MYTLFLYLALAATIIQVIYWLFLFLRLAFHSNHSEKISSISEEIPVSIIICAHNEAENLEKNLPRFLNQTYRSYELIVVLHNSYDKSLDILTNLYEKHPNLRSVSYNNEGSGQIGKKFALAEGIKNAQHELLLLTDADCLPASDEWLNKMVANLDSSQKSIGLGYSPYQKEAGFLNQFIRYEAVWTAIQYLSFALAKMPYMGVGRNLLYYKKLYEQAGGFSSHKHIASGDDDLFVNAIANGQNTCIIIDPKTFVYSEPKHTWRAYIRQKKRHLSTATSYQIKHQLLLGLYSASHFLHYTGGLFLALYDVTIFFTLYAVRMGIVIVMYALILRKLRSRDLLLWVPLLDLAYLLFYIFFLPALMNTRRNTWN